MTDASASQPEARPAPSVGAGRGPRVGRQGDSSEDQREAAARRLTGEGGAGPALDRLAQLASRLLGSPMAQVSIMTDVQTIVGGSGLPSGMQRRVEALSDSLCTLTTTTRQPLVVTHARADPRVAHLPPVQEGLLGAYLGIPLTSDDGHAVGALCVFDPEPREWSPTDLKVLEQLASSVVAELELTALSAEFESSRLRWALAVDAAGIGTYDMDVRTGALRWDERLLELFGYDESTFGGTIEAFNDRVHPEDLPHVSEVIQAALEVCGELDLEYRIVLPSGESRWVQARGRALCDEQGRAARLVGAAYDITARRDGELRLGRVLESMSAAFYSLDHDWRFSYVNAEAERLLGRSREELLGASLLEAFPAARGTVFEEQYRAAFEDGEPTAFEAYYPEPLNGWYEVRAWPGPDGLAVYFLDITQRKQLQDQAARTAAHLALVAEVSSELSRTLDTSTAVTRLARLVVPALGDWCIVTVFDDDGRPHDVGSWHVDPAQRPVLERFHAVRQAALTEDSPVSRTLRTGRSTVITAGASDEIPRMLHPGEARDLLTQLAPEAVAAVPLHGRGRVIGLLTLYSATGSSHVAQGAFTAAEDVAARAGLALDNARLYDQQRRLAEGLQRSLLTAPPEPDHLHIVVRYRPAAEAAQVGGDWYDAFLQSDGATVLVIGDVVGHDTAAAAAMGQIRGLLRGIAYHTGAAPAEVLSGLDAAMEGLSLGTTATAVIARLEQGPELLARDRTRLRWSNAGHPPPMVVDADGVVAALTAQRADLLLGIDADTPRRTSVVELEAGSTLLLYTDGLVERRDQGLEEGLERLREALADLAGRPTGEVCDELLARLVPSTAEDDVALVAVRLYPHDGPRPRVAGPQRVPPGVPPPPS